MAEGMIRVECECGKAARVPSRYAGRMVKCSGCGGKITIPGGDEGGSGPIASSPSPTFSAPASEADASAPAPALDAGSPTGGAVGGAVGSAVGGAGGGARERSDSGRRPQSSGARDRPGSTDRGPAPAGGTYGVRSGGGSSASAGGGYGASAGGGYGAPAGGTYGVRGGGQDARGGYEGSKSGRRRPQSSADPYAPPAAVVDEAAFRPPQGRGRGPARDLNAEAHIVAIGIWQRVLGVLYLAGGGIFALVMVGGIAFGSSRLGAMESFLALLFGGVGVAFLALYYQTGVAVMAYKSWGRIVMAVFFVLYLGYQLLSTLINPFSFFGALFTAAWGGAQMWALFGAGGARVFSPSYAKALHEDRRPVPWAKSPFFWLPIAFWVLIIGLMILSVFAVLILR